RPLLEVLVLPLRLLRPSPLPLPPPRHRPRRSQVRYRAPPPQRARVPSQPPGWGGRAAISETPPGHRVCYSSGKSRVRAANRSNGSRSSDKFAWCPTRVWPPFTPSRFRQVSSARIATEAPSCQKQTEDESSRAGRPNSGIWADGDRTPPADPNKRASIMADALSLQSPEPLTATRPHAPLTGKIRVPGDKSISHRALMLGALAVGRTEISGLLEGEDVLAAAAAINALGAHAGPSGDGRWTVDGVGIAGLAEPDDLLDLGNSGAAARLLLGILATHPITAFV